MSDKIKINGAIMSEFNGGRWPEYAVPNCEKCRGSGALWNIEYTPAGPWVCKCVINDEKYQPLFPDKETIFSNEDDSVVGTFNWYRCTDPLTISYPYTQIYKVHAKISTSSNKFFSFWKWNWDGVIWSKYIYSPKVDYEARQKCIEICKKIVKRDYTLEFKQSEYNKSNCELIVKINGE